MSKDFFDDSCCNNNCCNSANDNLDTSCFWILIIFIIFMGIPFGKDCFWNGYCNAFNSSGFACANSSNNTSFNFNNSNTNSFFNNN
ncbi:hypothetical protein H9X78_06355 [Clostridium saudiense]|nr:hypothetical protein [Clostridium saudiense]